MDINKIFNMAMVYIQANPLATALSAIILLVLLFWRPKILLILLSIVAAAYGLAILFGKLAATGLGG